MTCRYDYRDGWPPNPNQTEPVLVSGHAYSEDLITWHYSSGPQPFDPWVIYEDGSRANYSTFERPHLVFDENGVCIASNLATETLCVLALAREHAHIMTAHTDTIMSRTSEIRAFFTHTCAHTHTYTWDNLGRRHHFPAC